MMLTVDMVDRAERKMNTRETKYRYLQASKLLHHYRKIRKEPCRKIRIEPSTDVD